MNLAPVVVHRSRSESAPSNSSARIIAHIFGPVPTMFVRGLMSEARMIEARSGLSKPGSATASRPSIQQTKS